MGLIALLPDEVILKIFAYLDIIDLIHCGQVSKRFREISQDETLQKLNLDEREVPSNFLKLLISRGLKYLSFFRAKGSLISENFPIISQKMCQITVLSKVCVNMCAGVAWHLQNFRTSCLTPTDFEALFTTGTGRALFHKIDASGSFKSVNTSPAKHYPSKERMLKIVFDTFCRKLEPT